MKDTAVGVDGSVSIENAPFASTMTCFNNDVLFVVNITSSGNKGFNMISIVLTSLYFYTNIAKKTKYIR